MRSILVAIALLFPAAALAQVDATARTGSHRWEPLPVLLTAGELSGAAAGRTITINNPKGGYATAVLTVDRTRSAGTSLTATCLATSDSGAPEAVKGVCSYDASGICKLKAVTMQSPSDAASEVFEWEINVLGRVRTDCVFVSAAADGDDELTVTGILVTQ